MVIPFIIIFGDFTGKYFTLSFKTPINSRFGFGIIFCKFIYKSIFPHWTYQIWATSQNIMAFLENQTIYFTWSDRRSKFNLISLWNLILRITELCWVLNFSNGDIWRVVGSERPTGVDSYAYCQIKVYYFKYCAWH